MSTLSKALAILTVIVAGGVSGTFLTRQVIAVAGEADAERLNRAILSYIAEKNPGAPIKAFQAFPEVLVAEAQRANVDHCLILAQAEVESEFRHDAVGRAGEVGLFQMLPSTAALFEPSLGKFKRPAVPSPKEQRDLGDLANPAVSTRFAMAYLRDILARKPNVKDALLEYNGGPTARRLHYYRMVMGTYVELLERPELRCLYQPAQKRPAVLALLTRA